MAITRTQLEAAAEALKLTLRFDRPADTILHHYFTAHHGLGAGDRAFVAETVYGVLRRKRTVDKLAPNGTARQLALAYLVRPAGASVRELAGLLTPEEREWLPRIKAVALDASDVAARTELPDWIAQRLLAVLGEPELLAAARALNEPAPLDLRVNTLKTRRDEVLEQLAADGIAAAPTPLSPVGVRVQGRPAINRHALFVSGAVEVQDESSQILGYLVAPRRHDFVVDFCAGSGGKSLLLGAMMRSQGRIYALDTSAARLARLKPRLKRSGLSNIHPHPVSGENDTRVKRFAGKADRVLVDAPCSGLGTLRRNPDIKWRQSPQAVAELTLKQAAILRAAAAVVRPGGRLVYATCSLLPEENDGIVAAFLREQGEFTALDCGQILRQHDMDVGSGQCLRLWPHLHGTDGFFAAVMEKSARAA